jgi:putative hydrolase of HD superfamily
MPPGRVAKQLGFLSEADRLKSVLRRTSLIDGSRLENSAEHSWHLVLVALVVREHAPAGLDELRVLELLAVHDLVEIDAGDTFAYDKAGIATKAARERAAADRIFGLLPDDQRIRLRALWDEFEAHETPEAQFANAIDRFQALLQNAGIGGGTWHSHNLTRKAVLERMAPIEHAIPGLWPTVVEIVDEYCR